MRTRNTLLGLLVCGLATTSCASVARDAVVDAYEGATSDPSEVRACQADAKMLETATEAFYAQNGVSPQALDDLVPAYVAETPVNWIVPDDEVGIVSNLFSPAPNGPCDGVDIGSLDDNDDSIGQIGVDAITDSTSFNCTYDQRALDVAIETYVALNEMNPSSMSDLDAFGLIQDQTERWTVGPPANADGPPVVTPTPGGGCD